MANRLASSASPYLLQHRENPVDWWPWSQAAFDAARSRDVPVFLSIGYSTCHWCHVMERESFEDAAVARLMNEAFVNIKVDREERPDIDSVYMTVCQMLTGSGGWPLTIVMTPDRRPFFAGTYFPRESRFGRIGMLDLVPRIRGFWQERREEADREALRLTGNLTATVQADMQAEMPSLQTLDAAYQHLKSRFDEERGGFGSAPKFPAPHGLMFLLRYWRRTGKADALRMVEVTLEKMRMGGIFDQVGYGFHRYSTDADWKLPHFEKMAYDQALHVLAYAEAFQATGKPLYRRVAREVIAYVLRDLTGPEGGFHTAEDADSEGREGKFYVWHERELEQVLGEKLFPLAAEAYSVRREGNFADEATGRLTGENILHLTRNVDDARLAEARGRLLEVRQRRVRPGKDDKVLTDWNGLMIAALSVASRAFDEPQYAAAASRAATFIRDNLSTAGGRLLHRWRRGESGIEGMLDDYAFYIWGLIELYQTTYAAEYLEEALLLATTCLEHFRDDARGAFFLTADDAESLVVRPKDSYDGACPSGNSVMMINLLHLARLSADAKWEKRAHEVARCFAAVIQAHPSGFTGMLSALDFALGPSFEVVIAGDPEAADTKAMLEGLRRHFLPRKVVMLRPEGNDADALDSLVPGIAAYRSTGGAATAYVCRSLQCDAPTTSAKQMMELLADA